MCFEDEWRSYRFGMTWRWDMTEVSFWLNYPFKQVDMIQNYANMQLDQLIQLNKCNTILLSYIFIIIFIIHVI